MLGESLAAQPEHETISVKRIETLLSLVQAELLFGPTVLAILSLILSLGLEFLRYHGAQR